VRLVVKLNSPRYRDDSYRKTGKKKRGLKKRKSSKRSLYRRAERKNDERLEGKQGGRERSSVCERAVSLIWEVSD